MPQFIVRSRKTNPIVDGEVTADSREHAIQMCIDRAGEGEEIEVLDVKQVPEPVAGATGISPPAKKASAAARDNL